MIGLLDMAVLVQLGLRMRFARPVLAASMEEAFGPGAAPRFSRLAWWRVVLVPFVSWRPGVRRVPDRQYGSDRRQRLDLYLSRRAPRPGAPVLLYLHPGGFRIGSKLLGGQPMFYRLAAQGWVVASANYRLGRADYADQLADARAAASWLREHVGIHGGDPGQLFLAGGSAGAHFAATAALTGTDAAGVIGFYGYYGSVGPGPGPRSPHQCHGGEAPPFLIVHGTVDTLVRREDAGAFAEDLHAASGEPVGYAEVPGMHHNFDFFYSPRFSAVFVNDGIESALARARQAAGEQDVRIAGGGETLVQYLNAGLIDEFHIALSPVLFGSGIRLFDDIEPGCVALDLLATEPSPRATHLRYAVRQQ